MTPLTEHQKELAARELCRLRGIDPEDVYRYRYGEPVPVWVSIVAEIEQLESILLAIEHGRSADA